MMNSMMCNRSFVIKVLVVWSLILGISGCNSTFNNLGDTLTVDFSNSDNLISVRNVNYGDSQLNVAVSAMISPKETFVFYEELFNYISEQTGSEIVFKQRKTYEEVNLMIENNEVDLAFICSGAYALGKEKSKMEILAIPVSGGKKYYQAFVLAHVNSNIRYFEDLHNKKFAFTDPMSHCGKLYPEKRLKEIGHDHDFFSKTIFSHAHDISMQLVSKQIVDGASIQSPVYEYIKKFHPERINNLKIIEKSENYGMPPLVVPQGLDKDKKEQLRELFLTLHEDPIAKKILDKLLIDKFIPGNDQDYDSIRKINTMLSQ